MNTDLPLIKPVVNSAEARILHTMLRVRNLEKSLTFYIDTLGMKELRRENYSEGQFTLSFIGYGTENSNTVIELTHNWNDQEYQYGNAFGHLAISVRGIYKVCNELAERGVKVTLPAGPMNYAADNTEVRDIIAFVEDPDGYCIELIETR